MIRRPWRVFASTRRLTGEVSERLCYQAEVGRTNDPRCLRPLHAYYLVSRVVVDITKANELATPVKLCVDFARPFSSILYP
jgi:hypothetical protein